VQRRLEASIWMPAAVVILGAACRADAGDLFYGVETGLFYDNNVSRAQPGADVVGDSGLSADATLGAAYPIGEHDTLSLSANLRAAKFQRFHGLDVAALGGTLSYRTKFGLGPYAPRAAVNGFLAAESYGNSVRNGRRSRLSLELGRRFSAQWDVSGGFAADRFDASKVQPALPQFSRDAFSIQGRSLFARAEYAWSERWLGYLGVSARRGDVVSSSRLDPEILEYSSAVVADPAFGPDYFAYKLAGRTNGASFGASLALSQHASLNIGLTREITNSQGGIDYRSTQFNALFLYTY
jgi:hypothetical protein